MIVKSTLGIHENVVIAEFGHGDIKLSCAKYENEEHNTLLLFHNHEPREIGETSDEWVGKTSDDLPCPDLVFKFTKPESITALIHSLVELQKEVFKHQQSCPVLPAHQ